MNIGIIIQARTGSNRLPKKVLNKLPINSEITVLEQVIRRVKCSLKTNEIIIATTESSEDDEIINIAKKENVKYFRGSSSDVLSRYYYAAKENKIDIIVRITSDCPCVDFQIIDYLIEELIKLNLDYVSNALENSYPKGLDVEVFKFETLYETFLNGQTSYEKEHVTPYMSDSKKFKIKNIKANIKLHRPEIRITLDTYEDYMLICAVYDYLYNENIFFKAMDIVDLFDKKPWLNLINNEIIQKPDYNSLEEEIAQASRILDCFDLKRAKIFLKNKI